MERTAVALRHWTDFDALDQVLATCLADLGGMEHFVRPGQTVVIKPNLTADAPASSGGTTHVEIVEALVRQAQRCRAGRVVVAEGTGAFGASHETAFLHGGWREMAARTGVELYNLDVGPHTDIVLDHPRYPFPMPFSKLVLEADVFITVPWLKTHISADYTVALKNSYCLVPQWKRSEIHSQYLLEEALVDINRIRKPDLTVVDGWDGAEGVAGGNSFRRPAGARLMLLGADPVAVDVVSRALMEQTVRTRYLEWAIEEGLGVGELDAIGVRGDPLEECRRPFMSTTADLCDEMPQLTVHDRGACSGCRCLVSSAVRRLQGQKMLRPLQVVFGGEGDLPALDGSVLVAGKCAKCFGDAGIYVEGCPPHGEAVMKALDETGCFCHQCRDLAHAILPELPAELLDHLRVVASGTQVHVGSQVKRHEWHLVLLLGDCMERYAQVNIERAAQFGLDPERDLAWVKGCPAHDADARAAVEHLKAGLASVLSKARSL